ncbi:PA containing protein [Pseudonocardia alni]|jgi:chromosome segregation ATPase|uniref:Chromosome segregation ATPase n=1 Tax=Pseudonocardia alni TaxID=33907 RepID=A0A852WD54_PSEA5|nr:MULTISPECIES: PA containing protein [Pseudonocardia]MYW71766.1 PA containing protein [Pseudonocardia sp. SID8383]NYG03676.1 chromosome segregation ATPase [Pseudonocardia antarctica]
MSDTSNLSFDRMRGMLMRAAEIRDSEQQQIFDSLDEIHARLAALDAIGTVRKKLTELPDRTELNVLAERLDETVSKLDNTEIVLGAITRAIESLPDKLAKPIAQLDGRLDGMGGRLEGVSGRMDGLDDRLGGLHKRLDDLDNRLDRHEMRLDAMPNAVASPIKERVDGVERQVREQLDAAVHSFEETGEGLRNLLGDTSVGLHRRLEDLAQRPAVDPAPAFDALTERLEALSARLEEVGTRLDSVESGLDGKLTDLDGSVKERVGKLGGSLKDRLGELDGSVTERLSSLSEAVDGRFDALGESVDGRLDKLTGDVDGRLDKLTGEVDTRLEKLAGDVDKLSTGVDDRLAGLDTVLRDRPDTGSVSDLVTKANAESERRNASQLDEAMATFAELIMGRGGQYAQQAPPPPPRPAQRRGRAKVAVKSQNGASAADLVGDDPDD